MDWVLDTRQGSRQRHWVTQEHKNRYAAAREAGQVAHQAKAEFVNAKRAGFTPAELRPLKTKATEAAKQAAKLDAELGAGVFVVEIGRHYLVRRFRKPAHTVSSHDTLEAAQKAAEKVK